MATPESIAVADTRVRYAQKSINATAERAQASMGTTVAAAAVGSVWAASASLSAASLATAGAVGVIAIPPLAPALLGVMIATIFVLRQKGLNKELLSNLYFIKMEVERMWRVHNVIKDIAEERGINLNTASLSSCMDSLKNKIMLFADKQTKRDIQQLEAFLKEGDSDRARTLIEVADGQGETAAQQITKQSGGAWLPTGWSSRWLSPDETLRQIIRDITIAGIWFSIMLGEFDIFMRYMDNKNQPWARRDAMKQLLTANKQLGLTTGKNASNSPTFEAFYQSIGDIKSAVKGLSPPIPTLTRRQSENNPSGGTRAKRRRRYSSNAKAARQKSRRTPR